MTKSEDKKVLVGHGKLSSQGTGTFPAKGRSMANWLEGDKLSYWYDPNTNDLIVHNETLNNPMPIEVSFYNKYLHEQFNSDSKVIVFEGTKPLEKLLNYLIEYEGYLNPNEKDKGKFYLSPESEKTLIGQAERRKNQHSNNFDGHDEPIETRFLKEYSRYVDKKDGIGVYIFEYHEMKNDDYLIEVKNSLEGNEKIILWGYHHIQNVIKYSLQKVGIQDFLYLEFKQGKEPRRESLNLLTMDEHIAYDDGRR